MRMVNWVGCIFAAGLAGCSLYPIPDDVSPFSTEKIVRYGRCEMRSAILVHINGGTIPSEFVEDEIIEQIKSAKKKEKEKRPLSKPEVRLLRLAKVAVVYSFDFNITEHNRTAADVGFRLPWLANVADAGAAGALDLTRQGTRVFGAEFSWEDLIADTELCAEPWRRSVNFVYPITGTIGVGRVVETFINIDGQGGAKDNFVDTLTFTTLASGGADASVKLEPVPNQFRLVSATAAASSSRLDIHKLTLSLAFPRPDAPQPNKGVTRVDGDLNAPFTRPADWRARYNLCVADARARESSFKILRLEAPEVYCIRYADAFSPQTGLRAERDQSVLRVELQGAAPGSTSTPPATGGASSSPGTGGGIAPQGAQPAPRGGLPPPPRRIIQQPLVRGQAPL
jgi:hypothetical protein